MDIVREKLGINKIHGENIKGKDITIAFMDTGISKHYDLRGRIVAFYDAVYNNRFAYDDNGHGTHIAGICCGNGRASGGRYTGVCPMANIVAVKVLDERGKGNEYDVVRAADWIIDHRVEYGIRIVNISFGMISEESVSDSILVNAVEKMAESGILVVVAAGNNGPKENTITSPGISRKVITVGALDDIRKVNINGRYVNEYSGVGSEKSEVIKPDVIAPATMIKSCGISKSHSDYVIKSGTSMAAPIVSGCIGLLLCQNPQIENYEVKNILRTTSKDRNMPRIRQGYGLIDPVKMLGL